MSLFISKPLPVSAIQSLIIQGEKKQNIEAAFALLDEAIKEKPKLICLTQAFGSGINFVQLRKMAEPIPEGNIAIALSEKAKLADAYIAAGILELGDDGKIYDSAVLFGPDGKLLAKYRRWILWHGERSFLSQGAKINCIETEIGRIGMIIGYDICFPESVAHYFFSEVDIIICVASIFDFLSYNVQQLCSSRAMDNHCYLVFSSAIGEHPIVQKNYMGLSAITCDPYFLKEQKLIKQIEPASEILAKAGKGKQVIFADLYIGELKKSRGKNLPFLGDLTTTLNQTKVIL